MNLPQLFSILFHAIGSAQMGLRLVTGSIRIYGKVYFRTCLSQDPYITLLKVFVSPNIQQHRLSQIFKSPVLFEIL